MKLGCQRNYHKAFNQEKAIVGAFSVIEKTDRLIEALLLGLPGERELAPGPQH